MTHPPTAQALKLRSSVAAPPVVVTATAAQLKALAHPVRLRILRFCLTQECTNQELAELLNVAPATSLRHVRELVAAGFMTAGKVRTGRRGARERPYRATGRSWRLAVSDVNEPELSKELQTALVLAHLAELQASPTGVERSQLRGVTRLHPAALREFRDRIETVLREYGDRDDPDGLSVNFLWSLHGIDKTQAPRLSSSRGPE